MAWLATRVDLAAFLATLGRASLPLLGASLVLFVADDVLVTYKWGRLLAGAGVEPGFLGLFRVYLEGRFLGFFIPSSVTSDLYKGAVLTRAHGSGNSVVSSIVLERLLGLVSIATISVVAVGALPAKIAGLSAPTSVAIAATATLAGLAVFLQADRIIRLALPHLPARWTRLPGLLQDLAGAFSCYRAQGALLCEAFFLSLLIQLTRSTGVWVLALSLADRTPFHDFLLLVPYVYLVNLLPIASSRLGLEQGVFVALFSAVGMPAETALAISLLSVASSFLAAIPGGIWLLVRR